MWKIFSVLLIFLASSISVEAKELLKHEVLTAASLSTVYARSCITDDEKGKFEENIFLHLITRIYAYGITKYSLTGSEFGADLKVRTLVAETNAGRVGVEKACAGTKKRLLELLDGLDH